MVDVKIGDLTFYGDRRASNGWVYRRLQGWYSSAPMRGDSDDRPLADGAFELEKVYRSARPLQFTGHLFATTSAVAIRELWAALAAVQADGALIPLSVTDDTGTLTCMVSVNGTIDINELTPQAAEVTAPFIAYDPIKYGETSTNTTGLPTSGGGLEYPLESPSGALFYGAVGDLGRVSVSNAGTATTWPVMTVAGGLDSGFYLQCLETGQVLRYDHPVPVGATVSLDARTGEVLIDGTSDGSTYLSRDEWFSIPAGGSVTIQFNAIGGASGTPQMTVVSRDGWW